MKMKHIRLQNKQHRSSNPEKRTGRSFHLTTLLLTGIVICSCASCKNTGNSTATATETETAAVGPQFNEDSAWAYCNRQCEFGPRTMNSVAHEQCKDWIVSKFREYGCNVTEQKADLRGYDGTVLKSTNIIARTSTDNSKPHILLCAHYDSRPWADNDPDSTNWRKPVIAANDGASGVAVMLEIARLLQNDTTLNVAVDFVCFDAEDWGAPKWANASGDDSWALGSKYWAKNIGSTADYAYSYGILLDMVGGEGARFYHEGFSQQYAQNILDKVWNAARAAGYSSFFPSEGGGYVTDDHVPLNEIAKIPTIDIIPFYPDCEQSSFGPTWHTVSDDMQHIDKNTLKAVGQTIIQTLFSE